MFSQNWKSPLSDSKATPKVSLPPEKGTLVDTFVSCPEFRTKSFWVHFLVSFKSCILETIVQPLGLHENDRDDERDKDNLAEFRQPQTGRCLLGIFDVAPFRIR